MKKTNHTLTLAVILAFPLSAFAADENKAPDNTAKNERDRENKTLTLMCDQETYDQEPCEVRFKGMLLITSILLLLENTEIPEMRSDNFALCHRADAEGSAQSNPE